MRNQKGMSTVEVLPLIVLFMMLLSYGLGFFGIVHSAILQSIAARTYAFETFRNRTNLAYFRENVVSPADLVHYQNFEVRVHAIVNEEQQEQEQNLQAAPRPLAIGREQEVIRANKDVHTRRIYSLDARNRNIEVNPIWIMIGYGMCINASCGD